MRVPSGDHTGSRSLMPAVAVSSVKLPPSTSRMQMSVSMVNGTQHS